ncbi:MAG TPA: 2-hydroxyhepta-2,4-diene-1,7-dioate isomerase, partial [Rhodanobacteraceae bacterium]|nr:2-hydroxyhepta-2,4-diene-1,7-dioate isomerase [Rhodanobacteraceae bacterium]
MKLLRIGARGAERTALVDGNGNVRDASALVPDLVAHELPAALARLRAVDAESLPLVSENFRIAAPLRGIGKIVCIGLNYIDHARETGQAPPREPILFLKATSSIV